MSQNPLSRELALRIGLSARALPNISVQRLLTVLTDALGLPITEEKLATLNLKTLKTAHQGEFLKIDDVFLKKAVHTLKHPVTEALNNTIAPIVVPYVNGDIPKSIRIACASNDFYTINGHFGSCERFMIYQVSAKEVRLIDNRNTEQLHEIEEDKNRFRAKLIADCQVLYLISIGGPAAAKIIKLGIHPIKLPTVISIDDAITELQRVLAGMPPPWLAKIMGINPTLRCFADETEDEIESVE